MMAKKSKNWVETGITTLLVVACVACSGEQLPEKIEITTADDSARELYLEGRDRLDNFRLTDAHELMQQALAKDENFALAHLGVANTSLTTQEFLDALGRAVAASDGVSEGEQWMILGMDAVSKGAPASAQEYFSSLVKTFPNDERAHVLLGGFFFGIQDYDSAVTHLHQATVINSDFAPAFNMLGYANQFLGSFDQAETAFKSYIELIPTEPNPYDSYAEFLMKAGRFDQSIENYQKALELDKNFFSAYVGIGTNHSFKLELDNALAAFRDLYGIARNDGEKRQALLGTATAFIYAGDHEKANLALQDWLKVSVASKDLATIAGDLNLIGTYLSEIGLFDAAQSRFDKALEAIQSATVAPEIKALASREHLYNQARLAVLQGDLETATRFTEEYVNLVDVFQIPGEIRKSNELLGLLALEHKEYRLAVIELEGADLQDPRVLYYLAKAYVGVGDRENALPTAEQAASFNGLTINFAYIRAEALQLLHDIS